MKQKNKNISSKSILSNLFIFLTVFVLMAFGVHAVTNTSLDYPANLTLNSNGTVAFNCTFQTDTPAIVSNLSLWGNWNDSVWKSIATNTTLVTNATSYQFNTPVQNGTWLWNCQGYNNASVNAFASANRTIIVGVDSPQSAVNLGTAGNFIILSKSGISTTGVTSITGNIGVSPIGYGAITGFSLVPAVPDGIITYSASTYVNGSVYASDYADPTPVTMTTAVSDMETAYTTAAGLTNPTATELGAGNIGGMTLAPGLYKWGTGVTIPTDVTLSGSSTDVWIFQIAQTLGISPAKKVLLSGGAQAKNIFWQVAGQTTLGTTSVFNGNILDQTAVVINTGATLNGRAFAQTAVTLDANTVSLSGVTPPSDILPPVISLVSPPANNWSGSIFTFNYTDASIASCTLFVGEVAVGKNSSVVNNTNTVITANASLSQGSNNWYVNCTDQANNVGNSSTRTVFIDLFAPTSIINSVNGRTVAGLGTTNPTLNINFTANDTNIINWTLSLKNSTNELLQNWTESTNNLSMVVSYSTGLNGTYFINLSVLDNASTRTTTLFNITVDQSNPIINSLSIGSITTSDATLTANATDTYSGILNCTYSGAGSGILSLSSGLYTSSLSGLSSNTDYEVTVNCTDKADNSVASTVGFKTSAAPSTPSSSSSGGGGGGGGGAGPVSNWPCTEWSACSSGIQTRTCTQPGNSLVTSKERQSCTPTQTVAIQNTTAPTAPKTTDSGSTGQNNATKNQNNNVITPAGGNPITGQAVSQSGYLPPWWVTALALLGIIGLIVGGYFYFNNPKAKLPKSPKPIARPN